MRAMLEAEPCKNEALMNFLGILASCLISFHVSPRHLCMLEPPKSVEFFHQEPKRHLRFQKCPRWVQIPKSPFPNYSLSFLFRKCSTSYFKGLVSRRETASAPSDSSGQALQLRGSSFPRSATGGPLCSVKVCKIAHFWQARKVGATSQIFQFPRFRITLGAYSTGECSTSYWRMIGGA
jgi:hypothetical protein